MERRRKLLRGVGTTFETAELGLDRVNRRGDGEVVGAGEDELGDRNVARAEGGFAVGEIVAPFAEENLVEPKRADGVEFFLEGLAPAFESQSVVRRHVLVVEKIQVAAGAEGLGDAGVAHEERAGEDVLLDEIHAVAEDGVLVVGAEDRLEAGETARGEERVDFREVAVHIFVAHSFEHFDRGDFVELPAQVAVVAQEDLDFFAEPGGLDAA